MDALNNDGLSKLASIMEKQLQLLQRMDERQVAADLSSQPIPQVPAESNSTWGPLLLSRAAETIQPKVERWRSGLDALLVFLGLFSSIVTAFLVDSLNELQPDEVARTNQLLANLTEIVIQLNTGAALHITSPPPFAPDPVNVRLNSYWFISLILSLSVAALAVACRSFLNMVLLSGHKNAVHRLIDINRRWKRAEKILGPAIEVIPQLLIIPVILFVVGLLDDVFSSVLALAVLPVPIAAALALSLLFLVGLVGFLLFALSDAIIRPHDSPFPSTLSRVAGSCLLIARHIKAWFRRVVARTPFTMFNEDMSTVLPMRSTYHEVVQATYDDNTLDCAAAALHNMLASAYDLDVESVATFIHLLSPEASRRCNHTAARVIVELSYIIRLMGDRHSLLVPLTQAARRSVSFRPLATLWSSEYIKALAVIISPRDNQDHPPVMSILGSSFMSAYLEKTEDPRLWETRILILDVFFNYFAVEMSDADQNGVPPSAVVGLFEPDCIQPQHVLASARFLADLSRRKCALTLVWLLMAAKTPAPIVALANKRISDEHQSGNIRDLNAALTEGYLVIKSVLTHSVDMNNDFSMADLCSACVLGVKQCVKGMQSCGVYRPDALQTLEKVLERFPSHGEANRVLADLMVQRRKDHPWEFDQEYKAPSSESSHYSPQVQPGPEIDYSNVELRRNSLPRDEQDGLKPPSPVYGHTVASSTGQPDVPASPYGLSDVSPVEGRRPRISFEEFADVGEGLRSDEGASGLRRSTADAITATIGTRSSSYSSVGTPMGEGGAPASD